MRKAISATEGARVLQRQEWRWRPPLDSRATMFLGEQLTNIETGRASALNTHATLTQPTGEAAGQADPILPTNGRTCLQRRAARFWFPRAGRIRASHRMRPARRQPGRAKTMFTIGEFKQWGLFRREYKRLVPKAQAHVGRLWSGGELGQMLAVDFVLGSRAGSGQEGNSRSNGGGSGRYQRVGRGVEKR